MKLRIHLFEWPSRHNVHLALPLMIVLSVALHAACVVVFQVAYPRPHRSPQRSAEVFFLVPGSPIAKRIAPLLAASDPALFSPGHVPGGEAGKLPETAYIPSFDSERPTLTRLDDPAPPPALPPLASSGPVSVPLTVPNPPKSRAPGLPTAVRFDGALSGRSFVPPENLTFSSATVRGLAPTVFLVAVSPEGLPLHVFPLARQSSGNEILDRAALRYLASGRFAPDPSAKEPAWGTAIFLWGSDVKGAKTP